MDSDQRESVIKSLGRILGTTMSASFDQYGSLQPIQFQSSIVGPLLDPIRSLHRDCRLENAGPWPSDATIAVLLALTKREHKWLTSSSGLKLFAQWRGEMHKTEDTSKTLPAFLDLAETLLLMIPQAHLLFPLPYAAQRPALSHADFHFSNVLVSSETPTIVKGIIDWEFTSIIPLWAAFNYPHKIADYGDELERDPALRECKQKLRHVFEEAVMETCADANIFTQKADVQTQKSIRGLRALDSLATSGVALYRSCKNVHGRLVEIRECLTVGQGEGVSLLDRLVVRFAELA